MQHATMNVIPANVTRMLGAVALAGGNETLASVFDVLRTIKSITSELESEGVPVTLTPME